jgi:hypothetical protein
MTRKQQLGSIVALMAALALFAGTSWQAWRVVLKAIFGLPMSHAELAVYRTLTARLAAPERAFREIWLIVGRRGGKSMIAALIAVYQTTCRNFELAPGERARSW